jgi:transporter family protein
MWIVYALLSALFAALTSVLAKVGIEGINSNLATAIRTAVVLLLAWGNVFATGVHQQISSSAKKAGRFWCFPAGTGGSWLFFL